MVACLQAYRKAVKEVPPVNDGDYAPEEGDDDGWLQRTYSPHKRNGDRGVGLDLRGCKALTDAGLGLAHPHLEKLDLSRCGELTGEGLLAGECPKLTSVSLSLCRTLTDDCKGEDRRRKKQSKGGGGSSTGVPPTSKVDL